MAHFLQELEGYVKQLQIRQCIVSQPADPTLAVKKISLRPVLLRGEAVYQISQQVEAQQHHSNLTPVATWDWLSSRISSYRQVCVKIVGEMLTAHCTHKGKWKVKRRPNEGNAVNWAHNRQPCHPLSEEQAKKLWSALGMLAVNGQIKAHMAHKYRQVQRYIQLAGDALHKARIIPRQGTLRVVDFGCGKSYLSFSLFWWLTNVAGFRVEMTGVDQRSDLIQNSQLLCEQLNCQGMRFVQSSIREYVAGCDVDLVISLHACDRATDEALASGVAHRARIILAAPCCQHELLQKLGKEVWSEMIQYPIIRERFAALATDVLRARWLESQGYRVQIVEFIETEHTPKNLLLRAIRRPSCVHSRQRSTSERYQRLKEQLGLKTWCVEELHAGMATHRCNPCS